MAHLGLDREACAEFVAEGGNEMLFWAGRLALAAHDVLHASVFNMSVRAERLSSVLTVYDAVVMAAFKSGVGSKPEVKS